MRNVRDYYPPKDYHRVTTASPKTMVYVIMDWLPLKCMDLEYRVARNGVSDISVILFIFFTFWITHLVEDKYISNHQVLSPCCLLCLPPKRLSTWIPFDMGYDWSCVLCWSVCVCVCVCAMLECV